MPVRRCIAPSAVQICALIVLTFLCYIYLRIPVLGLSTQFMSVGDAPVPKAGRMVVGLPLKGQTTRSYWLQEGVNPLAREGADSAFVHEEVDIVVIGGGITGVSAVHHLVQGVRDQGLEPLKVVLLEARDFCPSILFLSRRVMIILFPQRLVRLDAMVDTS